MSEAVAELAASPEVAAVVAIQEPAKTEHVPVAQAPANVRHTLELPPDVTAVSKAELELLRAGQSKLASYETAAAAAEAARKQAELNAQIERGQVKEALETMRREAQERLALVESQRAAERARAERYALDGEVSRVLADQPLVPGGAEQLTQLWRNQFTVEATGDTFSVRTPTYQSVSDFVKDRLARPEYAHFVRSSTQHGGTGGQTAGAAASSPTPTTTMVAAPKTLSEAALLQTKALRENGTGHAIDGLVDPSAGFGGFKGHAARR